jgi:hypothetical protein
MTETIQHQVQWSDSALSSSPTRSARGTPPLFLIGAERSGTTMLRLMLSHHPQIEWLNEFEYAIDFMPGRGEWPSLDAYLTWLETHRIFLAQQFRIDRSLDYPALVHSFMEQKRERAGKPIIGATVHRNFDRILDIWPDAHFIYLLRDGRDVARSAIAMGWAGNVWYAVDKWMHSEQLWAGLRARLDSSRWIELRYEDLITHPEGELTRVCEFIGVPYSPDMLSYPGDSTYSAPDSSYAYRWKTKLGESDLALMETKIGALLVARGYERAPVAPASIGWFRRARLSVHNRYRTIANRIDRYGLGLWLALAVTSRIGPKPMYRRVIMRCNTIDRARLK